MRKMMLLLSPILFAFLTGWFLVRFLTVHPFKISIFLTITLLSLIITVLLLYAVRKEKGKWGFVIFAFIGFFLAYMINTHLFLSQEDTRFVPELTRCQDDQVSGHTAILYFTHGEPETYDPIGWLNQFREFDEQGIRFIPKPARPVFIAMLRKQYLQVGKSNHRSMHLSMMQCLEELFRQEGDTTTRFYICFLDDEPRPDAALIQALNDVADEVIVVNVFLTISNHTAAGQSLIQAVDAEKKCGVKVRFTEPFWNSETLQSVFIEKVAANMQDLPKEKIAVALIGYGQPDEWDTEWPTETQQEIAFRDDIIKLFIENGFPEQNLGSAWMEFKSPKPAELMHAFIQNEVEKIFYFSAAISADAIPSQAHVPGLVNKYKFPEGVEVINLGAWNNHPTVIRAIKERISESMNQNFQDNLHILTHGVAF